MNRDEHLPASFALTASSAVHKVFIRIAGGCKDMSESDMVGMLELFSQALRGFQGVISSGATRELTPKGAISPMVTEIAPLVAAQNRGCVSVGTAPRTAPAFRLQGESIMHVSEYGAIVNPGYDHALLVQRDAERTLDWNGDLPLYEELVLQLLSHGRFQAACLVVWNGGGVTKEEAQMFARHQWPVYLMVGSGRGADELASDSTFANLPGVFLVEKNAQDLRTKLIQGGFLRQ